MNSEPNRPKPISRREQIEKRRDGTFVRDEDLQLLRVMLGNPKEFAIINVWGMSGIGKSTLLDRLVQSARAAGSQSVTLDLGFVKTREGLLYAVARGVRPPDSRVGGAFESVRARYLALNDRLLATEGLNYAAVARVSKAQDLGGASVTLEAPVDEKDVYLIDRALAGESAFFHHPEEGLAEALKTDLIDWFGDPQSPGLVIALDRSEQASDALLSWFRDAVFLDLGERVVLVVAGQKPLDDTWDDAILLGARLEVKPLADPDGARLAEALGVTDRAARDWVARASRGVPVVIQAFSKEVIRNPAIAHTPPDQAVPPEAQVQRLLGPIPEGQRSLFLAACVLRRITAECSRTVLGNGDTEAVLELFRHTPYVSETQYGYVVHDLIRDFCTRHLRLTQPKYFRQLHERAAAYYRGQGEPTARPFSNSLEVIHHLLHADPDAGLALLKDEFAFNSLLSRFNECDALVNEVVRVGFSGSEDWVKLFRASVLRQQERFDAANKEFKHLLERLETHDHGELYALAAYHYAVTSWYICDFGTALEYSKVAVQTLQDKLGSSPAGLRLASFRNRSIGVTALALDRQGHFDDALKEMTRMVAKATEERDEISLAYGLSNCGYFSYHAGQWRQAEEYLQESKAVWSNLKSDFGLCYPAIHRVGLRSESADREYSSADLVKMLEFCRKANNREMECQCLQYLAHARFAEGDPAAALDAAAESEKVAEKLHFLYFRIDSQRLAALCHLARGSVHEADTLVRQWLPEAEKIGATYLAARLVGLRRVVARARGDAVGLEGFDSWATDTCANGHGRAVTDYATALVCWRAASGRPCGAPTGLLSDGEAEWVIRASLLLNLHVLDASLVDLASAGVTDEVIPDLLRKALRLPPALAARRPGVSPSRGLVERAIEQTLLPHPARQRLEDLAKRLTRAASEQAG
jgi:tetratricopeptide (TPR) repeat protein